MGGGTKWLDIVSAAYRLDLTDDEWLDGVAEVLRPHLDHGFGVYAQFYRAPSPDRFEPGPFRYYGCPTTVKQFTRRAIADATPDIIRVTLLSHPFGTASDAIGGAKLARQLAPADPPFGIADSIAVNAVDPVGNGCVIMAAVDHFVTLTRTERSLFTRITAHLAAGHRLRRGLASSSSLDTADAIFDSNGRVQHATEAASSPGARAALVRAIANLDRAHSRRRDPLEALDLWTALVAGKWSIVDRVDTDGRRYFVAWRNDPAVPLHRTLTERELQTASYAALGHSNKLIAYSLGLTTSTVATHLSTAQVKLGVRSRVELIELVRKLRWSDPTETGVHEVHVRDQQFATIDVTARQLNLGQLSSAERAIAQAVLRGLSDKQIASARGTSPRTVANQLRRIYERLGVSSRAELAATLR